MFQLNGQYSRGVNPLAKKFILPAMLVTSVAYMQYSTIMDARSQKKAALRMLSKIPMDIKDLNKFNTFEINAITRRNTLKNKLVGRQILKSCAKSRATASRNKHLKDEEDFGTSSTYSKASVDTESSVCNLKDSKSILKSSELLESSKTKSVTFTI
ncbi:unnamed protein product [Moneuplotes crassus]|uniref:Uncharacterized protein n=1 Tax=Euplotes crassus TaxID=5936 RepID=A0AAD2CYA5_EUPCR|nr:unnamed protein product [Moneuplotes crassus]